MIIVNTLPQPEHLGSVNGAGQTLASFTRGLGPLTGAIVRVGFTATTNRLPVTKLLAPIIADTGLHPLPCCYRTSIRWTAMGPGIARAWRSVSSVRSHCWRRFGGMGALSTAEVGCLIAAPITCPDPLQKHLHPCRHCNVTLFGPLFQCKCHFQ